MEIEGGLTMSKPAQFGQRAALAGTRVGQKLSHLTTRRVIIGKLLAHWYSTRACAWWHACMHEWSHELTYI